MDVAVNAVWLAYGWAREEKNEEAATAIESLILDWPMDLYLIPGDSSEDIDANMFKWAINHSASVERLRDFVGLEHTNLLRIIARAAELVQAQAGASAGASAREMGDGDEASGQ